MTARCILCAACDVRRTDDAGNYFARTRPIVAQTRNDLRHHWQKFVGGNIGKLRRQILRDMLVRLIGEPQREYAEQRGGCGVVVAQLDRLHVIFDCQHEIPGVFVSRVLDFRSVDFDRLLELAPSFHFFALLRGIPRHGCQLRLIPCYCFLLAPEILGLDVVIDLLVFAIGICSVRDRTEKKQKE